MRRRNERFPKLLEAVWKGVYVNVTRTTIEKIKEARVGSFLVVVNGDSESATLVCAEVECSLGLGALVKKMEDSSLVELTRDRPYCLQSCECAQSLRGGGRQTAVVRLPVQKGGLRVCLVYTRVRPTELPSKCYQCLSRIAFASIFVDKMELSFIRLIMR